MKKFLAALMFVTIPAAAQNLSGDWSAVLHYSSGIKPKPVILHIEQAKNGRLSGNLRGAAPAFWIPVDSIALRDRHLSFTFAITGAMAGSPARFDPLAEVAVKGTLPIDGMVALLSYRSATIPDAAVMHLREKSGRENRNLIEFTHCRAFRAESTLRFDASPDAATPLPPIARILPLVILPAGLRLAISLVTPITDETTVGSLIEGKVTSSGALVRGRVRRLERYSNQDSAYFMVVLEFTDLDSARFFADFEGVVRAQGVPRSKTLKIDGASRQAYFGLLSSVSLKWEETALPGVGSFFVRGEHFRIPAGFETVWITRALADYD